MPRTEAGKRYGYEVDPDEAHPRPAHSAFRTVWDAIDAIEAEARASLTFPESMADAVRRERARIRAAVEGLATGHGGGWVHRREVLRIIDGEDTDA